MWKVLEEMDEAVKSRKNVPISKKVKISTAADNFTINTDFTQPSVIKIYDNQGKIVLVQKIIGTVENINVSGLQQGVYILAISNGNQVVRKKLQILR